MTTPKKAMELSSPPMVARLHEAVGDFSDGLALVYERATNLYGFIDRGGGFALPPAYAEAWGFSEGLAAVSPPAGEEGAGLYGYIDKDGAWLIAAQFADARPFSEGLAGVQAASDGMWGYVDATGAEFIPPGWDRVGEFNEGVASVARVIAQTEDLGLVYGYAYINIDGGVIWQDQALAAFVANPTTSTLTTGTTVPESF
jgi:hypothetical protein